MTIAHGEPDADMHTLVLQLLGAFSSVQDFIDQAADAFFYNAMPKARDIVLKLAVSRIRDDERIQLFLAIADDCGCDANLASFKAVYRRVKILRDNLAHSAQFRPAGLDRLDFNRRVISESRITEVDRRAVLDALRDCAWMEAQVLYVMTTGIVKSELRTGSTGFEVPRPPTDPNEWDRITYRPISHNS